MNDFSLLVGGNNSGKSNAISAIRAFYGDIKFNNEKDFPKLEKITTDNESWVEITFMLGRKEQESLDEKYKNKDGLLRIRKYLKAKELKPVATNSNAYVVKTDSTLFDEQFYGAKGVSEGKIGNIIFIPSVSKIEDTIKTTGASPFRDTINYIVSDILKKSKSFSELQLSFDDFSKKIKAERNSDGVSLDVLSEKINKEISSWKEINFSLDISNINPDLIIKNLITPKLTDENCGEVETLNTGQGFQRSLITSLIKVDANLRINSKKIKNKENLEHKKVFSPDFTLILFEEPEAFLHFTQEEKLNENLRILGEEKNKQVLVATHSPYFIGKNIEDISSVIKLSKNNSTKISQIQKQDLEDLAKDNEELSKILKTKHSFGLESEAMRYFIWLDSERSSMFFAEKVLIVEGMTEKVFLDYLFANEWKDIQQDGLYVLDSMGKYNTVRFMSLLKKLNIEHFVLFDKDKDGGRHKKINKYIEENKNALTKGVDCFYDNFEDFLGIEKPYKDGLKPLNALYKLKKDILEKERMILLKKKIEKLLIGSDRFDKKEIQIEKIIILLRKIYKDIRHLKNSVSVEDNGEWNYKLNLAIESFSEENLDGAIKDDNDSCGINLRHSPDKYYYGLAKNVVAGFNDYDGFGELIRNIEPLGKKEKEILKNIEELKNIQTDEN